MWRFLAFFLVAVAGVAGDGGEVIEPPHRVGLGPSQRHLTLQESIERAMRANLDVQIERTNLGTAEVASYGALGGFDPIFRWQSAAGNSNQPAVSALQGAGGNLIQHSISQTFLMHEKTPWNGLTLDAAFANGRTASDDPFVALSPFYISQLTISMAQPLWRGRGIDAERTLVKIRAANRDTSAAEFEIRAIQIAVQVEQTYWDLVAARRQSQVDAEAANLARVQLEQVRRMIAAGSLAAVEASAAEAELEKRIDELYRASNTITETENELKTLLAHDPMEALWSEELLPADGGAVSPPSVAGVSDALAQAMQCRAELKVLDANLAANEISRRQKADLTKPQIDLVASYSLAGLAGQIRPLPGALSGILPSLPGRLAGGLGTSLSSLFSGDYASFQAGLAFDITGRNRSAKADLAESCIERTRLQLMRVRTSQAIEAQVRNALQALESARQRMSAAAAAVRAAGEKLSSESRLFEKGKSTNFLVLTRQKEYSDARRREIEAEAVYNKAVAGFEAALGITLTARGIRID